MTFAYDPALHGDLYFGGPGTYSIPTNETWLFNTSGWHVLAPPVSPPVLYYESMAWDAADQEMVLFGGTQGSTTFNATWTFANGTWTNATQPVGPPPTIGGTMFSDPEDGSVILFGGDNNPYGGSNDTNATWEFVGGHWRALTEGRAPSAREDATASWDSTADEGILFGGIEIEEPYGYFYASDSWAFLHGAWTPLSPTAHPPAGQGAVMGDDPALGGVVLFGEYAATASWQNATWVYAQGNWTRFTASPAPSLPPFNCAGLTTAPDGFSLALLAPTLDYANYTYQSETWEFSTLQPTIVPSPAVQEGNGSVALTVSVLGSTVGQNVTWWFGDGTTGTGASVSHVYSAPGAYHVTATVTDRYGRVANTTQTVRIYPDLALSAGVTPPVGVSPLTVALTGALSGGDPPYSLNWSSPTVPGLHGDVGSVVIGSPGTYWITLSGTDAANHSIQRSFMVTVYPDSTPAPLSVEIVTNVTRGIAPVSVAFVALPVGGTPPYAFDWRFSDGSHAAASTVARTIANPGSFGVALTVADALGISTMAATSILVTPSFYVVAQAAETTLASTVTLNATGFDGVAPYTFYWAWGDGTASTGGQARHTFARSGTYDVELTGIDAAGHTADTWSNLSVAVASTAVVGKVSAISVGPAAFIVTAAAVGALAGGASVLTLRRRRPPSPDSRRPTGRSAGTRPRRPSGRPA